MCLLGKKKKFYILFFYGFVLNEITKKKMTASRQHHLILKPTKHETKFIKTSDNCGYEWYACYKIRLNAREDRWQSYEKQISESKKKKSKDEFAPPFSLSFFFFLSLLQGFFFCTFFFFEFFVLRICAIKFYFIFILKNITKKKWCKKCWLGC